jgi:inner membrane protein
VDNLTHSLLGGVLAELALPAGAARTTRRIFFTAGIVAANLPDVDILYTRITTTPLGYLLHHRGHSHTVAGVVVQGALLAALCLAVPAVRRLNAALRRRLAVLGGVALASHLLLDSWNSYGVHPFHPLDSRWYYGDAVFIFEPWLWVLLGVAVAANAERRGARMVVAGAITLLPLALTVLGVLSPASLAALAAGGLVFAGVAHRRSPFARAGWSLAGCGAFVAALFGLGSVARAQARALLGPEVRGELVDVILSPHPAAPPCWFVIAVEKDEAAGRFVLHRGTLSLVPSLVAPEGCALHRLWRLPSVAGPGRARLARGEPITGSLDTLRHYARDCRVHAWLQFGRAPFFSGDEIRDLRFETGPRENFTAMPILEGGGCPSYVTSWDLPRADLLD